MLNKDDAVQIDNVNCEGEKAKVDQAYFERSKVCHSVPENFTGFPSSSSTLVSKEVKSTKSSF